MEPLRSPYQGVWNIVRFNWPFFAVALLTAFILLIISLFAAAPYRLLLLIPVVGIALTTATSLLVSFYIYDLSDLYRFSWLNSKAPGQPQTVVTVNAGFDETSALLQRRFPLTTLHVFDFYDPALHTEPSIRRARKAYPPYPGTQPTNTATIPLPDNSVDVIFLILAAHEIRQGVERIRFFVELNRILRPTGTVVVVEHLRDAANFLAYTIGFLHFLPRSAWKITFAGAGFFVAQETKITPFVTAFFLKKR